MNHKIKRYERTETFAIISAKQSLPGPVQIENNLNEISITTWTILAK